ncbi:MAG: hypothetical protein EZS28_017468 [Streblomastix strix]|uniref:Uncharacterized protein n=1 Tax=Streblomastix strix TaxID=222440 RepID=A0A5J4VWP5_9EUKA|nr:MAG: hypothetical protein EZS28_017468 [Streblomastix strix]
MKIIEILKLPLKGTKQQIESNQNSQESECVKMIDMFKDKKYAKYKMNAINHGIALELVTIYETRDLPLITTPLVEVYNVLLQTSSEVIIQVFNNKNPYPGLFRLIQHKDNQIVLLSLQSICSLLKGGLDTTEVNVQHPHYNIIDSSNGIKILHKLFKTAQSKELQEISAICIGYIYRSKEIQDKFIKKDIITFLKNTVYDLNEWTRVASIEAISLLAQNQVNLAEIISDEFFISIAQDLRKQLIGIETTKKQINQKQENECEILQTIITKNPLNDDIRLIMIKSGIAESLLYNFQIRDISKITLPFVQLFLILTDSQSNDVKQQILDKHPYAPLLRIINHNNSKIIEYSVISINNIISLGLTTSPIAEQHPDLVIIEDCKEVENLFNLTTQKDVIQSIKDIAAVCIGNLFRAKQIPTGIEVISILMSLLNNSDLQTRNSARNALNCLAQDKSNFAEIMKRIDLKSIVVELMKPLVGSEEQKKQIINEQEMQCSLIYIILNERKDEQLLITIIDSGIVALLLSIFETRNVSQITQPFTTAFRMLTQGSIEITNKLLNQDQFPSLLRLLNHNDVEVISDTMKILFNIIYAAIKQCQDRSTHPYFDTFAAKNGSLKFYSIFKRNDISKETKECSAFCIGFLHRNKEIANQLIRVDVISNLKTFTNDTNKQICDTSNDALFCLSLNLVNREEIVKGGFQIMG